MMVLGNGVDDVFMLGCVGERVEIILLCMSLVSGKGS
jgi:hypothetical protein